MPTPSPVAPFDAYTIPLPDRVQAGAARLNEVRPGWHHEVDLDTLDFNDCFECVIGQLYGNFSDETLPQIGLRWHVVNDVVGFGFVEACETPDALRDAWVNRIEAMRVADPKAA